MNLATQADTKKQGVLQFYQGIKKSHDKRLKRIQDDVMALNNEKWAERIITISCSLTICPYLLKCLYVLEI